MKKIIVIGTLIISTSLASLAELQDIGDGIIGDPELAENANVNVVFNNEAGVDYSTSYWNIIMGNVSIDPLPLSSVTSQISNITAVNSNLIGGSLIGPISGDVRTEISNFNMSSGNVSGGSVALDGNDIGGSIYLTINSGTCHTVIGGYFIAEFSNDVGKLSIGGSTNVIVNGGSIVDIYGGSAGRGSGVDIQAGDVNVVVNAADSSNKVSVNYIYGLSGEYTEHADRVNILFTGNGGNLDVGNVSAIGEASGNASADERVISFGSEENAFVGQFNGKISNVKIGDQNQFNEFVIGKDSSVEFTQDFELSVDTLSIFSDSELSGGAKITVDDALNIYISDGTSASDIVLDLGESIVLSAESQENIYILHEDGSLFDGAEFAYDPKTNSFAISNVPEPSTCAAIFGALALALAAYRGRKQYIN